MSRLRSENPSAATGRPAPSVVTQFLFSLFNQTIEPEYIKLTGSQGPSPGPGLQKPFFPIKKEMKGNKLLKPLVLRGPCSPEKKKKKNKPCPTQQAYDLLGLQSHKRCLNNMKQETPPISSSKQALFFLEVGRVLGERVRLADGAQAWNWRPRLDKTLCLCPHRAGQVWVCPFCAHP